MTLYDIAEQLRLRTNKKITEDRGFFFCPFHPEKNESLSITVSKNAWHCFSCNRSGSLGKLSILLLGQNIFNTNDFSLSHTPEGTTFKQENPVEQINFLEEEKKVVLDISGVFLPVETSLEAFNYVNSIRGIPSSAITTYNLKFMKAGTINNKTFINRLIIPLHGVSNKIVCYEGRDITKQAKIKVLYPPNSLKPIFNFNNLKSSETIVVFEGIMDALFFSDISSNVTALLGSNMSDYQLFCLKMLEPKKIMVAFDNDDAGRRAEKKFIATIKKEIAQKRMPEVIFSKLWLDPKYKDVNELWEKDKFTITEAFNKGLVRQEAYDFTLFR